MATVAHKVKLLARALWEERPWTLLCKLAMATLPLNLHSGGGTVKAEEPGPRLF